MSDLKGFLIFSAAHQFLAVSKQQQNIDEAQKMDQLNYQVGGTLPNSSSMIGVDGPIQNPGGSLQQYPVNNMAGPSNTLGMPGMIAPMPNNTNSIHTGIAPLSPIPPGPLSMTIDFSRPDAQRTRPLSIDNKKLYVDEHYVSTWSPILRSWFTECPG